MSNTNREPALPPPQLHTWLRRAIQADASDLHLIAGHPPILRIHGDLSELAEPALTASDTATLLEAACPPDARPRLHTHTDFDFSLTLDTEPGSPPAAHTPPARFRVNLFRAGGALGACFRVIPATIPDFEWAGFPNELAERLAGLRDGLVIFTGATGSGKTTSLAMIVDLINRTGGYRILTVEEPVEYLFPRRPNSAVTQREVGRDVATFADGLKFGLRQDPDVILVGEIRDRDTAQMALSAAETGHLVFTTLHTRDAKGAITRLPDLFPPDSQKDIRSQLAMSLRAVLSQRLLPGIDRASKRHLALEVLWNTHPIASAIRTGKVESIDNYLVTGRTDGMLSFDESIRRLLRAGKITRSTAEQNVSDLTALSH